MAPSVQLSCVYLGIFFCSDSSTSGIKPRHYFKVDTLIKLTNNWAIVNLSHLEHKKHFSSNVLKSLQQTVVKISPENINIHCKKEMSSVPIQNKLFRYVNQITGGGNVYYRRNIV